MVSVVVAGTFGSTESGLVAKLHVVPVGKPVQLRFTLPAKELEGATLTVINADPPTVAEATCVDALRLKVTAVPVAPPLSIAANKPCVSCARPAEK